MSAKEMATTATHQAERMTRATDRRRLQLPAGSSGWHPRCMRTYGEKRRCGVAASSGKMRCDSASYQGDRRWWRGSDRVPWRQVLYPVDLATGPHCPIHPMGLQRRPTQQMTSGPHCTIFLQFSNNPESDFQRGENR
jgi:hypothetical protein